MGGWRPDVKHVWPLTMLALSEGAGGKRNVRYWPLADIPIEGSYVRFWGY